MKYLLYFVITVLVCYTIFMPIVKADTTKTKVLFIHHSTGGNLLNYGKVRDNIYSKSTDIEFYDHGYNLYKPMVLSKIFGKVTFRTGLSDSNGYMLGKDFNIVVSNNSPKEYADIFNRDPTDYTLNNILEYDIIIFKNCFPTSAIKSDEQLNEYKNLYDKVKLGISRFPDKKFIIFTQPPLRGEVTNKEDAQRARNLADYLASPGFVEGYDNIYVFNFFDLLADSSGNNTNMLRREYTSWFYRDSHPNKLANKTIGPLFSEFVLMVVAK